MKRLLFVSNLFPDSGSPLRGLDNAMLLRTMADALDIRVLSPRPTLRPTTVRHLIALEDDRKFQPTYVPVAYIPKLGNRWNAKLMQSGLRREFEKVISDGRPDVVLVSWLYPDACAVVELASAAGLPAVFVTQGTDTHAYLEIPSRRRQILAAIDKAEAVICRSTDLQRRLEHAGADPAKLHTIYNGVDLSLFQPRDRLSERKRLGYQPDERILLFVGNLLPVKNPQILLRCHSLVNQRLGEPVKLVMIGDGPMLADLQQEAQRLGTSDLVRFAGPTPSSCVARHMNAADALCLTSRNEGLPNVVLEALASGLPIVSTDVGGIGEVVDRPERGLLVSPGDEAAYIDALAEALHGRRKAIARAERLDDTRWGWERAAQSYRETLMAACRVRSHDQQPAHRNDSKSGHRGTS